MGQSNEKPADAPAPAPTPSEGGDGGSGSGAALEQKPSTPIATFSAAPQSAAAARKQEKEPFRREGADLWIHVRRDEGVAPEAKAGVLLQGVERVRVTGEGDIELDGVVDWGCVRCLQITSPGYVVFGRHVADLNALEILEVSAKVVAFDKQPFPLPSLHTLTLRGVSQISYCAAAAAASSASSSAASAQDRCGHTHLVCPVLSVLSLPGVSAAAQRQLCFALVGSVLGASSAMPAVPDSASRRSTSDALTEDRLGPAGLARGYADAAPSREVGSGTGSGSGGGGGGGGVAAAGLGSVGVAAPAPPGRVASFLRPLPEVEEYRNVSPVRQWSLQALPPDPAGRGGRRQSDVLNVNRLR